MLVMSGESSSWSVWACERRLPWSKRTKKKEVPCVRSRGKSGGSREFRKFVRCVLLFDLQKE